MTLSLEVVRSEHDCRWMVGASGVGQCRFADLVQMDRENFHKRQVPGACQQEERASGYSAWPGSPIQPDPEGDAVIASFNGSIDLAQMVVDEFSRTRYRVFGREVLQDMPLRSHAALNSCLAFICHAIVTEPACTKRRIFDLHIDNVLPVRDGFLGMIHGAHLVKKASIA